MSQRGSGQKVDRTAAGILAARLALDLTQSELARRMGYSRNYITLLEGGSKPVTDEAVRKLTALLTSDLSAARSVTGAIREVPAAYGRDREATRDIAEIKAHILLIEKQLQTLSTLLGSAFGHYLRPSDGDKQKPEPPE